MSDSVQECKVKVAPLRQTQQVCSLLFQCCTCQCENTWWFSLTVLTVDICGHLLNMVNFTDLQFVSLQTARCPLSRLVLHPSAKADVQPGVYVGHRSTDMQNKQIHMQIKAELK